jgi:hypothetical protein
LPSLPTTRHPLALVLAFTLVVTGAGGACGSHRDPPETVVARSRARTLAPQRARVAVATTARTLEGVLTPRSAGGDLAGRPVDVATATGSFAEMLSADPYLAIDLVEGRTHVETYGGAEVRGASAFRYDLDVSPAKALGLAPPARKAPIEALARLMRRPTLFVDVWVDGRGRLVRIQLPADPNETRPGYTGGKLVDFVTVDLYGFQ